MPRNRIDVFKDGMELRKKLGRKLKTDDVVSVTGLAYGARIHFGGIGKLILAIEAEIEKKTPRSQEQTELF